MELGILLGKWLPPRDLSEVLKSWQALSIVLKTSLTPPKGFVHGTESIALSSYWTLVYLLIFISRIMSITLEWAPCQYQVSPDICGCCPFPKTGCGADNQILWRCPALEAGLALSKTRHLVTPVTSDVLHVLSHGGGWLCCVAGLYEDLLLCGHDQLFPLNCCPG